MKELSNYKLTALTAAIASFGLFANSALAATFDFETLSEGSAAIATTSTMNSAGWSDGEGGSYYNVSTNGDIGLIKSSGSYFGGVITNSTSNTGITYTGDVDSVKGGASSGNNYAVFYLNTAYAPKSTKYSDSTYYTQNASFYGTPDMYAPSFVSASAVDFSTIDISLTAYTYNSLYNGDSFMGMLDDDETLASIQNLDNSFYVIRIYGIEDIDNNTLTENFVDVVLAQNTGNGNFSIADEWVKNVDISSLNVENGLTGLYFEALSNFGSAYGMTAPSYVAIDNVSYVAVPESTTCAAIFGVLALAFATYKRRK